MIIESSVHLPEIPVIKILTNIYSKNYFCSMITFSTHILKFDKQGEKTGWTYIVISRRQAEQLSPGSRVSFRVKGHLDQYLIKQAALLPMGEGNFILPLNGPMRKALGKKAGDSLTVKLEIDKSGFKHSADFIRCLKDEPRAHDFFRTLPLSHQKYFSKWIEGARTLNTKTKRITMAVIALGQGQGYAEMIRANKSVR
jgi:hypothetical protein